MKNQPASIEINCNLTWEAARLDDFLEHLDCTPPQLAKNFTPQWYRDLKGDLQLYRQDHWRHNQTARYCKGLQGISALGWTIPLPVDITSEPNVISRKILVPEMLYGTHWNDRDSKGEHVWDMTVVFWPWRARLTKGWKLMVMAYPLDWSPDWYTFAGMPPHNYEINHKKNSIGNMYQWEQPLDIETYDYYNIETVYAFRKDTIIPRGSITFSAIIIPGEK